jgi:hypothetical protein
MKKVFLFPGFSIVIILLLGSFVSCKSLQPTTFKFIGNTKTFDNGERFFLILRKNGSASILKETSENKVYRYNYTYKINRVSGSSYINLEYTDYDSHNFIKDFGYATVKYKWRWYGNSITLIERYKDDNNKIDFYRNRNYKKIYR